MTRPGRLDTSTPRSSSSASARPGAAQAAVAASAASTPINAAAAGWSQQGDMPPVASSPMVTRSDACAESVDMAASVYQSFDASQQPLDVELDQAPLSPQDTKSSGDHAFSWLMEALHAELTQSGHCIDVDEAESDTPSMQFDCTTSPGSSAGRSTPAPSVSAGGVDEVQTAVDLAPLLPEPAAATAVAMQAAADPAPRVGSKRRRVDTSADKRRLVRTGKLPSDGQWRRKLSQAFIMMTRAVSHSRSTVETEFLRLRRQSDHLQRVMHQQSIQLDLLRKGLGMLARDLGLATPAAPSESSKSP